MTKKLTHMKRTLNAVGVYCGSNTGSHPSYQQAAKHLGKVFVEKDITLVYGGGKVGLMGLLTDSILEANGTVIGVIPQFLVDDEKAHQQLTSLHIVNTMHERKKLMADLADAFILMPGGAGSLDEFFEIFTWQKLGQLNKPCGILNINNYFDHLINFLKHAVKEGFLKESHRQSIVIDKNPDVLLEAFDGLKLDGGKTTHCFN